MTETDRDYPRRPLVGVGAVVFRGGEVLLIRRGRPPRAGEWSLPGGLQHLGETVFEAAAREVLEETGIRARITAVVDAVDLIERDAPGGRVRTHYTLVDVVGSWQGGDPVASSDAAAAAWIPLGEIRSLGLWSETERVVALARRRWQEDGPS